jgi:hypothetical protein
LDFARPAPDRSFTYEPGRVPTDHAERCLGHVIGGVRGIYDHYAYYDEKKVAFAALADQIDRIINPQVNVIPMRNDIPA